jgi:DNA-binding LytR/AlgR family response regulator
MGVTLEILRGHSPHSSPRRAASIPSATCATFFSSWAPGAQGRYRERVPECWTQTRAQPELGWSGEKVRASVGTTVRLIAVQDIDFLLAEEKYTQVAWRDDTGEPRDAVIRTALKELIPQLDAAQFAQVHRSVVVNLSAISHVTRGTNETADIHLKGRQETLLVSRTHLHLFRQM